MWLLAGLTALSLAAWRKLRGRDKRARHGVVIGLLVAALAASMAQTIVIAALPAFGSELGAPATEVAWVLTGFMLSSAVATPIAGRLGDMFGYRRVLIACLCCFTAGTVVAALATDARSLSALVAGRALQGVSGGVFPLAFGLIRGTVPPTRLPGVVAMLSAMFGIGGALGMIAAGPIVDGPGTAWLFWGTLVLAFPALAFVGALPSNRPGRAGRIDLAGAALLSGTLVCLLLAISQGRSWGWSSAAVLGLFGAAVLLFATFVVVELRVSDPMVDLRLMRRRALAMTNIATLVVAVAMFGAVTLVPQFVQAPSGAGYGFGLSATGAGLVMIPIAALMLVASPQAARIGGRFGSRVPLQLGAACAAVSFLILTAAHSSLWEFLAVGAIIGAGYGLAFASVGNLVVAAVDPQHTGMATGINTIVRTIGGAVGAQIAAAILTAGTPAASRIPAESGYTTAFAAFCIIAVLSVAIAFTLPARRAARDADALRPA
jgi:EmrB/QacA subfamily drug resistance transporter